MCLYWDQLIGVPICLRFRGWPCNVTAALFFAQKGGARSQGGSGNHGKGREHVHGTCMCEEESAEHTG